MRTFSPYSLALCLTFLQLISTPALAAQSPGSILPQQGPLYDDLVNQPIPRTPVPQEGREGYVGTYTDPATGDNITTIISPRAPQQPQQQIPIIVQPRLDSYGVQDYDYHYNGPSYEYPGKHPQQGSHRHNAPFRHDDAVAKPHRGPSPNLPGNKVQHPGLGMYGGNPGNLGSQYLRPGNTQGAVNTHGRPGRP